MKTSDQLSSLFSHTDNESDYEEEKRKKKLKITMKNIAIKLYTSLLTIGTLIMFMKSLKLH